ncbi:MAG: carbon-nitrogen hydrolase family protein [Verrucomicrobiota bacterium]
MTLVKDETHSGTEERNGKVRVACIQYAMRGLGEFDELAERVRFFVESAAENHGADFVLFPEFMTMPLLSAMKVKGSKRGIRELAELTPRFVELMSKLAREQGLHVIAGSHPIVRSDERIENCSLIFKPDGDYECQPKLHITPSETEAWDIAGGNSMVVLETAKAKIGVLICYDVEFPEAVRHLVDQGIEILFGPYCTDDRQGHLRVSTCAAARAIENQIYVATAGCVGELEGVPGLDLHYGQAAVFTPSDLGFARDGIAAQADPNVETMLVADLDISSLHRARSEGTVRPLRDRRRDLFEFRANLGA